MIASLISWILFCFTAMYNNYIIAEIFLFYAFMHIVVYSWTSKLSYMGAIIYGFIIGYLSSSIIEAGVLQTIIYACTTYTIIESVKSQIYGK